MTPTQHEPTIAISSQVMYDRLQTSPEAIAACCEKWQIVELSLFSSVWRYVQR